jgi:hypothetical protein
MTSNIYIALAIGPNLTKTAMFWVARSLIFRTTRSHTKLFVWELLVTAKLKKHTRIRKKKATRTTRRARVKARTKKERNEKSSF